VDNLHQWSKDFMRYDIPLTDERLLKFILAIKTGTTLVLKGERYKVITITITTARIEILLKEVSND
jgi:hypothetical protein